MSEQKETAPEEAQFHPFRLLGVILGVTAILAVICYGLQIYYIGPG